MHLEEQSVKKEAKFIWKTVLNIRGDDSVWRLIHDFVFFFHLKPGFKKR